MSKLFSRAVSGAVLFSIILSLVPQSVLAAPIAENSIGPKASLDPVSNKVDRLKSQGASSVDSSTGAMQYSYPIAVPPGRGGMAPKLTLSYNSQNNHSSWFGYAWNIDVPYIERINKYGSEQIYSKPVFASSLHGELISTDGANFEMKNDDGSFPRYLFTSGTWKLVDRDGNTYFFGDSDSSREQSDSGVRVGRWYLSSVVDKFGNGMTYSYMKDGGVLYPLSISYTEHPSAKAMNRIDFVLEDKTDPETRFNYGFAQQVKKRISAINISTNGTASAYINFAYTKGANGFRTLLASVEEKRLGSDGSWITQPKTTFTYENSSVKFSGSITLSNSPFSNIGLSPNNGETIAVGDANADGILTPEVVPDGYYPIDINGDFRKDFMQSDYYARSTSNNQAGYRFNTTSGYNSVILMKNGVSSSSVPQPLRVACYSDGCPNMVQNAAIGDVNGDGFDDIMGESGGATLNTGASTFAASKNANFTFAVKDYLVDVNGDGFPDRITLSRNATTGTYSVFLNTGTDFASTTYFSYDAHAPQIINGDYDDGVRFVDINNDGLPDLVHSYVKTSGSCLGWALSIFPSGNFNEVYINTGSGFATSSLATPGYLVSYGPCSTPTVYSGTKEYDINGDLTVDYDGAINQTARQDILKHVTTSLGGSIDVQYQWSTHDSASSNPNLSIPQYIVKHVIESTGDSATTPHNVDYDFRNGKMYFDSNAPRDRRFAGFGKVDITEGNRRTTVYMHQGDGDDSTTGEKGDNYYNIGRIYRRDINDISNINSPKILTSTYSLYKTYTAASTTFSYLGAEVTNDYNADGTWLSKGADYTYDLTTRTLVKSRDFGDIVPFASFAAGDIVDRGTDLIVTQNEYTSARPERIYRKTITDYSGNILGKETSYFDLLPLGEVNQGVPTKKINDIYNADGTFGTSTFATMKYDSAGNINSQTDVLGRTTSITYDQNYLYPATSIDAIGGRTSLSYDPISGQVKVKTGPDGVAHTAEYDGFGRVTRSYDVGTNGAIGNEVKTEYSYDNGGITIFTSLTVSQGSAWRTVKHYDALGRLLQEKHEGGSGAFSTIIYGYDANGNIISKSFPFETVGFGYTHDNPNNGLTTYVVDILGRVVRQNAGPSQVDYVYGGRSVTVQDNTTLNQKKSYAFDARNNLTTVVEYNTGSLYSTSYGYTPLGKLSRITDANGNARSFDYQSDGALVYQEDLHGANDVTFSSYRYNYDPARRLTSQVSPLGTTAYTYDNLDRALSRQATTGSSTAQNTTTTYGTCANTYAAPCTITSPDATKQFTYEEFGRVKSQAVTIDGQTYTKSYSYDGQGNVTGVTYPNGGVLHYTYAANGKQSSSWYTAPDGTVKNIVNDTQYNSLDLPSKISFGNGLTQCNTYTGLWNSQASVPRLSESLYALAKGRCDTADPSEVDLYREHLDYSDPTVLKTVTETYRDIAGGQHVYANDFTYDNLMRVVSVKSTLDTASSTRALSYDPLGNVTSDNGIAYLYSPDGLQNPDAATMIGGSRISYDAQGNRINIGTSTINSWDVLNHMLSATTSDVSERYGYDENGERVKRTVTPKNLLSYDVGSTNPLQAKYSGDTSSIFSYSTTSTTTVYISKNSYDLLNSIGLLDKIKLTSLVRSYYGSPFVTQFCAGASDLNYCTSSTTKQLLGQDLQSRLASTTLTAGLMYDVIGVMNGSEKIPPTSDIYFGIDTRAGIAYDSSAASPEIYSGSTLSFNHTTSGNNRVLFVSVTSYPVGIQSITYGGAPMSKLDVYHNNNGVGGGTYSLYYLVAPPLGTNSINVVFNGNVSGALALSTSYSGVLQNSPIEYFSSNPTTAYGSPYYQSATTTLPNSWIIWAPSDYAGQAPSLGAGVVLRQHGRGNFGPSLIDTNGPLANPGSYTYSISNPVTVGYFTGTIASFAPVPPNDPSAQIASYATSTFTPLKSTTDNYGAYIAGGVVTPLTRYDALPYVTQQAYQDLLMANLADTLKIKQLFAYSGATNTAKVVFEYTYKQKLVTLSDATLENMRQVALGNARLPAAVLDYSAGSAISISSIPAVSGISSSTKWASYNSSTYFSSQYNMQVQFDPRLTFFDNTPVLITQRTFNELKDVGIDTTTLRNYMVAIRDVVGIPITSKTEFIVALNEMIKADKNVTLSDQAMRESYLVLIDAARIANDVSEYGIQSPVTLSILNISPIFGTSTISDATSSPDGMVSQYVSTVGVARFNQIQNQITAYVGQGKEAVVFVAGVTTTASTTITSVPFMSDASFREFASTTLSGVYGVSRVFDSIDVSSCTGNASTTQCEKDARIQGFRTISGNLSGFIPSRAASEEFWMLSKGLLRLPVRVGIAGSSESLVISTSTGTSLSYGITTNVDTNGAVMTSLATSTCGIYFAYAPSNLSTSPPWANGNGKCFLPIPITLSSAQYGVATATLTIPLTVAPTPNSSAGNWNNASPHFVLIDKNNYIPQVGFTPRVTEIFPISTSGPGNYTFNLTDYVNKISSGGNDIPSLGIYIYDDSYGTSNWLYTQNVFATANIQSPIHLDLQYGANAFNRDALTLSTSTATTTINLANVPAGLLSDIQFNNQYSTSSLANYASTTVVSNETYNELLNTPIRTKYDVNALYDYAFAQVSSTTCMIATSSSCKAAQQDIVRTTIGKLSGFLLSDSAMEEAYRVRTGLLALIPQNLDAATMSRITQTLNATLDPSRIFVTSSSTGEVSGKCVIDNSIGEPCRVILPLLGGAITRLTATMNYASSTASNSTTALVTTPFLGSEYDATSTLASSTLSSYSVTGSTSGSSTTYDLTSVYNDYVSKYPAQIILVPQSSTVLASTTIAGVGLVFDRSVNIPQLTYDANTRPLAFNRSSLGLSSTTGTAPIDLANMPSLNLSLQLASPLGAVSSTSTAASITTPSLAYEPIMLAPYYGTSTAYVVSTSTGAIFDEQFNGSSIDTVKWMYPYNSGGAAYGTVSGGIRSVTGNQTNNGAIRTVSSIAFNGSPLTWVWSESPAPTPASGWGDGVYSVGADGNPDGKYTGNIQASWVVTLGGGQGQRIIAALATNGVAQGINQASYGYTLNGFDTGINCVQGTYHTVKVTIDASGILKLYFDNTLVSTGNSPVPIGTQFKWEGGAIYDNGNIHRLDYVTATGDIATSSAITIPVSTITPRQYPFIAALAASTTAMHVNSSATTTAYTVYTPFSDYVVDTRGTITTYFSHNGVLAGSYTQQTGVASGGSTATSTATTTPPSGGGLTGLTQPSAGDSGATTAGAVSGSTTCTNFTTANLATTDSVTATCAANVTGRLSAFPLNIPAGATIYGVKVTAVIPAGSGSYEGLNTSLSSDGGATFTSAKIWGNNYYSGNLTVVLGSETDTWGRTWSPADFAVDKFALKIGASTYGANLDSVKVQVYYTTQVPVNIPAAITAPGDVASAALVPKPTSCTNFTTANLGAADSVTATCAANTQGRLSAFPLNIPAGATIYGVKVTAVVPAGSGSYEGINASLSSDGGTTFTSVKTWGNNYYSGNLTTVLGSETDTWGRTWTPSDFNVDKFVLNIGGSTYGVGIDNVKVQVYFTTPAPVNIPTTITAPGDVVTAGLVSKPTSCVNFTTSNLATTDSVSVTCAANTQGRLSAFPLNIPAGATIYGVKITAVVPAGSGSYEGINASLSSDGGTTFTSVKTWGNNYYAGGNLTAILGGENDAWGRTWSSTDFAVDKFVLNIGGSTYGVGIDSVKVQVYYTTQVPVSIPTAITAPGDVVTAGLVSKPTSCTSFTTLNLSTTDSVSAACAANTQGRLSAFPLNLPSGVTIAGVKVTAVIPAGTGSYEGLNASLSSDGGTTFTTVKTWGNNYYAGGNLTAILGSETDTWGRTWAPSDFNIDKFVLNIGGSTYGAGIDSVKVQVFFSTGGTGNTTGGTVYLESAYLTSTPAPTAGGTVYLPSAYLISGVTYTSSYDSSYTSGGGTSTSTPPTGTTTQSVITSTASSSINYFITNHLGTPIFATDSNGDIVEAFLTDSFGNLIYRAARNDAPYLTKGYTGHMYDAETALTYAHARYLDTQSHSFMSVDPVMWSPSASWLMDPQGQNGYSYARNNPVMMVDPDGRLPKETKAGLSVGVIDQARGAALVMMIGSAQHGDISGARNWYGAYQALGSARDSIASSYDNGMCGPGWQSYNAGQNAVFVAGTLLGGTEESVAVRGIEAEMAEVASVVARGSNNSVVREAAAYGRQMHKAYKADIANDTTLRKEFRFDNGLRADFVDRVSKTIYELKPNNSRAISQGYKQLESYKQQMFKQTGEWYDTVLDTYTR